MVRDIENSFSFEAEVYMQEDESSPTASKDGSSSELMNMEAIAFGA
jgi:hypothetical protein